MNGTPKALLAHYFTNMTTLVALVCSGIVMLLLVYRQIRTRDEWRQNRVAFFSIWGLSCLFGTTWGLTFLDYGPLSDVILFLSCILNSFQGQCLAYTVSVQHSHTVQLIHFRCYTWSLDCVYTQLWMHEEIACFITTRDLQVVTRVHFALLSTRQIY